MSTNVDIFTDYIIELMKIEFDSAKDTANIAKHGVSLNDAINIEWNTLWATQDDRHDYGSKRLIGYVACGSIAWFIQIAAMYVESSACEKRINGS
jgi:uncharacterized DUF497 family protein